MRDAGEKFDPKSYISAVAGYYTTSKGEMLSFPFNSSTPVFYYNKDVFEKAGLDPNRAPATWPEVMAAAAKIKASGASQCAYTTGWPSWVHVENFSAWHNVPIAHQGKRHGGPRHACSRSTRRCTSGTGATSRTGTPKGYFTYAGRTQRGRSQVLQRRVRDADVARPRRRRTSTATRSSSTASR